MLINKTTKKLRGVVEMLMADSSRINEMKPQKYWYPLSMATYGAEEILEALDSLCSYRTSMWEKTERFEKMFSQYQGCSNSVMVNSGSSADLLLCFFLKELLDDRDEVIVQAVTWPTQIWSIMIAGLKPVLVDVDPNTLNMDYDDVKKKITNKTAAIFPTHLMGNPCDMDVLVSIAKKHTLYIIEDCCEGLGAEFDGKKIGSFGLGGAFSFFFSHHITTAEGGMISCNTDADPLRVLRAHGWTRNTKNMKIPTEYDIDPRYAFVNIGFNVRPTDLQAGFGIHQIQKLEGFNQRRKDIAKVFFDYVDNSDWLDPIKIHEKAEPSWLALPIMINKGFVESKKQVVGKLEESGIETRPIVSGNLSYQPVANKFPEIFKHDFPGADEVHNRGFYIGLSPMQDDEVIYKVIDILKDIRKNL